jgi:DNA-binding NtrC family response regulator
MPEREKQLHVRISKEIYTKLKIKCAYQEISIQDYIVGLIRSNMETQPGENVSVLIVEDEAIVRESLKDSLKDSHDVAAVGSAEEALELVKQQDFDVIVTDVRLPGMNGVQLVKEIKGTKPYIAMVIITAYPSVELAVDAIKQGAVDYLVKPVNVDDLERLFATVKRTREGKSAAASLRLADRRGLRA